MMAAETDRLRLSNRELFQIIRDNLPGSCVKTKNLIQCKDDILYVWDVAENGLFTLNTKNCAADDVTPHQLLLPTDPPTFDVENVLVNETATQLAVFGPAGVAVLDLPRRWGDQALFQGGKTSVICRCRTLDDRLFGCVSPAQLLQARWHPGSASAQHLLLLTSDNKLRLHDTVRADTRPRVWALGRAAAQRLPSLASLGETAVDFDFLRPVPPPVKLSHDSLGAAREQPDANGIPWQVLVLYGNGDVWSVTAPASTAGRDRALLVGPLPMYPADDDNYGVDASSVLCLSSEPPVVVIASCSGLLYHCLLLDSNEMGPDESTQEGDEGNSTALYVFESVELELGLTLRAESGSSVTCPIHLHHDRLGSDDRYFCSHDTGVHAISLPIIQQLDSYLEDAELPESELLSARSNAEYLLCTHTSGSALSPLLGLALTGRPSHLVALLSNGEVVSLPLVTLPYRPRGKIGHAHVDQVARKECGNRLVFPRGVTQPILKLAPGIGPQPQQCLELVKRSTQQLRGEYFQRHAAARDEVQRRVRSLRALRVQQAQDLATLQAERPALQAAAARLAEKYEDAKDRQQRLTERAERLLQLLSRRQPSASAAERRLAAELAQAKVKVEAFQRAVAQARVKMAQHRTQAAQQAVCVHRQKQYLAPTQIANTKAILMQCTEKIADLKQLVVMTKKDLGI